MHNSPCCWAELGCQRPWKTLGFPSSPPQPTKNYDSLVWVKMLSQWSFEVWSSPQSERSTGLSVHPSFLSSSGGSLPTGALGRV